MTQLVSVVECQRQAIKESIENEGPCSDSFMEEITQELGLSSPVLSGASSNTPRLVTSGSPANANTPSTRSAYNKQMVEPPPASSSPMDIPNLENWQDYGPKHDNISQQCLVPEELLYSPKSSNGQRRELSTVTSSCLDEDDEEGSPLADTYPLSGYGHDSNYTKTDNQQLNKHAQMIRRQNQPSPSGNSSRDQLKITKKQHQRRKRRQLLDNSQ